MDSMTRWWWIRHAPVVGYEGVLYGADDVPCDTSDAASFGALAENLPAGALLVTSALGRARATAEAIREAGLDLGPPLVEADLGEQHFGDWQGLRWSEMEAADPDAYTRFWRDPTNTAPPGGESFADVIGRTGRAVARLTDAHPGRDIVAVAHGGSIRAAVAVALDLASERAMAITVDNLSLTRIDHIAGGHLRGRGGHWRIGAVNVPPRPGGGGTGP